MAQPLIRQPTPPRFLNLELLLSYRPFADVLKNDDLKLLEPMSEAELTEVIEQPAQKLGVTFEAGLVERILGDVEAEPGILPLLEFALTELWQRRSGKQLTHAGYEAIGEVQGALGRHANQEYARFKDEADRERVRRIFIQLVRPGEGAEDTRRIATKAELGEQNWDLVKQLADARLVVTSRNGADLETVEVVHEALIRNWGELRGWMDTDWVFRAWQERLRGSMRQWQETKQDEGSLLRGAALAEAEEQLQQRPEELVAESGFIEQSLQERERLKQAETARRKREIRVARGITAGSLVATLISVGLGAVAFSQSQIAIQEKQKADEQAKIALARQLATQANLKGNEGNLQEFSTLNASSQEFTLKLGLDSLPLKVVSILKGIKPRILRFSPDQKLMAVADDKFLHFFEIDSGKVIKVQFRGIIAISFSPDGQILATAGQDAMLKIWSAKTAKEIGTLRGHHASLTATAFSPDGKLVVTASEDRTIKLWDVRTGKELSTLLGHTNNVNSVKFSPDGMYIITASDDHTAQIRNTEGIPLFTLVHTAPVRLAVFTPSGQSIMTVSGDTVVRIFDFSKVKATSTSETGLAQKNSNELKIRPDRSIPSLKKP
jgi:roadblock/LC7 domain-containing protein